MKKFAFVNEAAEREYKDLPHEIQDEFGKDLRRIQYDHVPELAIEHLGALVRELLNLKSMAAPRSDAFI